jgi:hypothetical protein
MLENRYKNSEPEKKEIIFFWLLISVLSTFFAEVTCANQPFAFWGLDKWVFMVPVYGLHILLLSSIFYNLKNKSLTSLYILGMFFGMYEFFLTKMAWMPTDKPILRIWEVSVDWALILVGFWHVLFAFIIPLLFIEKFVVSSKDVWCVMTTRIKRWKDKKFLFYLPMFAGFFHGAGSFNSKGLSFFELLTSSFGNCLFIMFMMLLWKKISKCRKYSMEQLLPNGKNKYFLLTLLMLQYIVFFFNIRTEALPERNIGYIVVFVMYACLWLMFKRSVGIADKKANAQDTIDEKVNVQDDKNFVMQWIKYSSVFVIFSVAAYVMPISFPVLACVWLSMIVLGACFIMRAIFALR